MAITRTKRPTTKAIRAKAAPEKAVTGGTTRRIMPSTGTSVRKTMRGNPVSAYSASGTNAINPGRRSTRGKSVSVPSVSGKTKRLY